MIETVRFCIQCGTALEQRLLFGLQRPVCPACGWIYFTDPKVAAGVLVEGPQGVLLVQRGIDPGRGLWSFPAGFVDAFEDPARAAERECLEETGLAAVVCGPAQVISGREHPRGADIVLVYPARVTGGELQAGDDAQAARFFTRDRLPELAFRATRIALGLPD